MELQVKPVCRSRKDRLELGALEALCNEELSRRKLLAKVVKGGRAIGAGVSSLNLFLPNLLQYAKEYLQEYFVIENEKGGDSTDTSVSKQYGIQLSEMDRNLLERILFLESSPFQLDATPFGAYTNAYGESLRNMLSVIENRVNLKVDEKNLYSDSWRGVLTQDNQFSSYTVYPKFCEKNSPLSLEEALIMRRIPEEDWEAEEDRQELELKLLSIEIEDFLRGVVTNSFSGNVTVYVRRDVLQDILAYSGYSRKDVDAIGKEVKLPVLSIYPLQIVAEDPELIKEKLRHVYLGLVLPEQ